MPQHVELNAPLIVLPFEPEEGEDGKELIIPIGETVYHYKMTQALAVEVVEQLGMTNDELADHHEKQAVKQSLRLPPGVDISKLNGGQG